MTYSLRNNIQFMYEYYVIEKQKIFCTLSMPPLRLAVVPVSCSFFESLFRRHIPISKFFTP